MARRSELIRLEDAVFKALTICWQCKCYENCTKSVKIMTFGNYDRLTILKFANYSRTILYFDMKEHFFQPKLSNIYLS